MLESNLGCFFKSFFFSRLPSFRLIGLIVLSSVLTACVSHSVTKPLGDEDGEYWRLKGRVSIKSTAQNGTFNLNWLQHGEVYDLRLGTSLGLSIAHVKGGLDKVSIDIPKQGLYEADNATELLFNHTGLVVPLASLRYWVRGNPSPKIGFERDGAVLKQSGWEVTYGDIKEGLPVRMTLTRSEVRIILLIHDWQDK